MQLQLQLQPAGASSLESILFTITILIKRQVLPPTKAQCALPSRKLGCPSLSGTAASERSLPTAAAGHARITTQCQAGTFKRVFSAKLDSMGKSRVRSTVRHAKVGLIGGMAWHGIAWHSMAFRCEPRGQALGGPSRVKS